MYAITPQQAQKIYDILGVAKEQRNNQDIVLKLNNHTDASSMVEQVLTSHAKEQPYHNAQKAIEGLVAKYEE